MRLEYFEMVDRIAALDLGARTIRSEGRLPDTSPIFEGHFPGYPIMPGVLMIETMAQTAGWLVMALHGFRRMCFLAAVKEAKMRSFLAPGQEIATEAELVHDGSGYAMCAARIFAEGKSVTQSQLTFKILDFPNEALREAMRATARRVSVPEALLADA